MSKAVSRRDFLKIGAASAAGVLVLPSAVEAQGSAGPGSDQELCTLLDISKCIGCEACVEACRETNEAKFPQPEGPMPHMVPASRVKVADWSSTEKREVRDRLTPYNWLFIQHAAGEYKDEDFDLSIPRRCMHCRQAPCSKLCPFGAAYKQSNGIVRIHPQVCMGGAKCKRLCPWHIPERQSGVGLHMDLLPQYAGNGVMYKCDRCFDRVAEGELPACIEACPEDVQTIGPRKNIVAQARQLAEQIDGFIYGETENGGTNTIYVSPVPFEVLAGAIDTGPGQPHIKPVDNPMGRVNPLLSALIIAPLAGFLGSLLRSKRRLTSSNDQEVTHGE
jgi:Fe-S-cluster-containing dehydrogenase component